MSSRPMNGLGRNFRVAVASTLDAFTCCCRWQSQRREEEEKEKLLARKRARDSREDVTSNGYQLQERNNHVRKVTRVGVQSQVKTQSRPLNIGELENILQNLSTLIREYFSIPSNLITMADVPPGAESKNRYKDILPNPHTRVALFLKFAIPNSDYINANYIRGYGDAGKVYIAAQGPLQWTVDDFWRMVWEQKTSVIVMVTGLKERRIVKCAQYWADSQTASYGDLDVTLKKRTANTHYTITQFQLQHREKQVSRDITHFWFTAWPDHGVPSSTQPALEFLTQIRHFSQDIPAPIVVHCSAGIGRTGVFIGADIGMTQLETEGEVDILKIVSTMRQDRGGMVQTQQQYIFLHQLLLTYAQQLMETDAPLASVGRSSSDPPDLVIPNDNII